MAKQQKKWIDGRGQEVPAGYVPKYDKARDKAVRHVVAGAQKLRAQMEAFMADAVATMNGLAGLKDDLGTRGNFSARSFGALIQISIRQSWHIRLDERVAKARELMLDYANRELESAGEGAYLLKQMIEAAFKVDRLGFLPRSEVAKLLSYKVNDASWNAGADILRQAQTTEKGKQYLTIETRPSLQKDFAPIRLDIADCWPEIEEDCPF
jgi:hypothetical protein